VSGDSVPLTGISICSPPRALVRTLAKTPGSRRR
jgi:hypothetical protein